MDNGRCRKSINRVRCESHWAARPLRAQGCLNHQAKSSPKPSPLEVVRMLSLLQP